MDIKNKNQTLIVVASFVIISLILGFIFLQNIYEKKRIKTSVDSLKIEQKENSNVFPLTTDSSSGNLYGFSCVLEEIKPVDIKVQFDQEINIKLLGKCRYLNAQNEEESIEVILGSLVKIDNSYYYSYERNYFPIALQNQEQWDGQQIQIRIDRYLEKIYGENASISPGDILNINLTKNNNSFIDDLLADDQSILVEKLYYKTGIHNSWDENSLEKFLQTGESKYIPQIENRKIIPAISIQVILDK